jgi:hypothetical protein
MMRLGPLVKLSGIAILLAISCGGGQTSGCGGGGCGSGCGSSSGYHYPLNDPNRPDAITQKETARVRITQNFLDFIRPQLPAVIKAALGQSGGVTIDADNVLHMPIPNQDLFDIGVASAHLRNGEALIWLDDLNNNLALDFEQPSDVHLNIQHMRVGVLLKLKADVAGADASCPVEGDIGPFGPGPLKHAAEISIDAHIDPNVGPDPDRKLDIQVNVGSASIDQVRVHVVDQNTYCAEPECMDCAIDLPLVGCSDPGGPCNECVILCGGIINGIAQLASALIGVIRPLLDAVLKPIIQNLIGSQLNSLNGQSAKIEQQISLATLVPIAAFKSANPMGLLIAPEPGMFPVVDRGTGNGMEITATGGAEGKLADCIGDLPDFIVDKGPVPDLLGTDSRNRPYHIGLTLASSFLNQIFYALHRSGSLCVKLTTQDVRDLTKGKFTMNASLLSLLSADISKLASDKAPVILELKPRHPGTAALGTGAETGMDAMGRPTYDWLIKLAIEEMGIAFHVLMQDRYVRLFEVTTDIHLGLNLNILPDNRLEVNVGDIRIDNFKQYFNEILPNADFGMLLPTLIEIVTQSFLSNALKFDLDLTQSVSNALNGAPIYMRVNDIMRDGMRQDYLTLTITFTSTPGAHLQLAADTFASLADDDLLVDRSGARARPTGRMRLLVGSGLSWAHQRALEYQARVDNGLWRTYQAADGAGAIVFEDGHLFVSGEHAVDLRARYRDRYETLDPTPVRLRAIVDPNAPTVEARIVGDHVEITVKDEETPVDEALALEAKLDDGPWKKVLLERLADPERTCLGSVPLASVGTAERLLLRASDPRGNTSGVLSVRLGLNAGAGGDEHRGGCACTLPLETRGRGLGTGAGLALFALLGIVLIRRRFLVR